jgi:hypothetical protein
MSDSDLEDSYSSESINNQKGVGQTPKEFFTKKELCYYTMIDRFFKQRCSRSNIKLMTKIIKTKSDISLRVLDHFAAKHSKFPEKLNFTYGKKENFNVRISYDAQLRTYKKKYFDPFRRKKKFFYFYDKKHPSKKILTTIGQLNFFRWAIENRILDFVKKNFKQINVEMKKHAKNEKDIKNEKNKKLLQKDKKKSIIVKAQRIDDDDVDELVLSFS